MWSLTRAVVAERGVAGVGGGNIEVESEDEADEVVVAMAIEAGEEVRVVDIVVDAADAVMAAP